MNQPLMKVPLTVTHRSGRSNKIPANFLKRNFFAKAKEKKAKLFVL
jgi:hypothetical protein